MRHDTEIGFYFVCGGVLSGVMRRSFAFLRLFGDCHGEWVEGGRSGRRESWA